MSNVFEKCLDTPQTEFWVHRGIQCAVHHHNRIGCLNGYALIPDGHPLEKDEAWGACYASEALLDVHGGMTFGPAKVEGGHVVGFDTNHLHDKTELNPTGWRVWSLEQVMRETERMADQIADLKDGVA